LPWIAAEASLLANLPSRAAVREKDERRRVVRSNMAKI